MELSREEIRLLLHFQFKLGLNASEAAGKVCEAYGDGTVGESTARRWFKTFREGNEDLTDAPRSGRPREVDRQAVVNAIEDNPSMTTRMLADDFDCGKTTIERILHEAGKKFQDVEEKLQNFFDLKRREFYRSGIYMLPDMWLNCIDSEGDYFDY